MKDHPADRDLPITPLLTIDREWCDRLGLPQAPTKKQQLAQDVVATNLWLHDRLHPGKATSYSRNNNAKNLDPRLTARTLPPTVERLDAAGLVTHDRAKPWRSSGRQSTMRPSEKLREKFNDQRPPRVKRKPGPLIRLKDEHKRQIEFRRSAEIRGMEREIRDINDMTAQCRLEVPNVVAIEGTTLAVVGGFSSIIDLGATTYFRQFSNGRTDDGGRLYGPYAQSLPKALRQKSLINGEPTGEYDYPALHARLLLALCGQLDRAQDLEADPYSVPGWSRHHAKVAFHALINARTPGLTKNALARGIAEFRLGRDLDDDLASHEDHLEAGRLLQHAESAYDWALPFYHSSLGLKLQRLDSDLIVRVALRLIDAGVIGLLIHDSIIVPQSRLAFVAELMNNELKRLLRDLAKKREIPTAGWSNLSMKTTCYGVRTEEMFLHNGLSLPVGVVPVLSGPVGGLLVISSDRPSDFEANSFEKTGSAISHSSHVKYGGLVPIDVGPELATFAGGVMPERLRAAVLHELGARGLTQDKAAAYLGLSRPQLTNALRGRFGLGREPAARLKRLMAA